MKKIWQFKQRNKNKIHQKKKPSTKKNAPKEPKLLLLTTQVTVVIFNKPRIWKLMLDIDS